ncbi:DUF5060 domain-containing protein [Haloferula sp.]|uniref:DUF5060 domain-containing protein n=1 Tax=Haloferula sp. TaxID=2497595 RepID=UPI00329D4F89
MKLSSFLTFFAVASTPFSPASELARPIASPDLVFEEKDGIVAIEAEHFFKQDLSDVRAWYLTTKDTDSGIKPDGDPNHVAGASGGAYLEILPDTRRTHDDKLIKGENFSNEPGKAAILSYKVHFNTPGKYWLWARAFNTGSEDNGFHFGINGEWPETAQRWQTVTRNQWHWKSAQRTAEVHTGVSGILTLEVPSAGEHTIHVCMREDGIELDKILLVNRKDFEPEGLGPESVIKAGAAPKPFPFVAVEGKNVTSKPAGKSSRMVPASAFDAGKGYYIDQGKWLAINPEKDKTAMAKKVFRLPEGRYDITLQAVGENDGGSSYEVEVGGTTIGKHVAPVSTERFEAAPKYWKTWKNVEVSRDAVISVRSTIASADGKEWSRARWAGLKFTAANPKTAKALAAMPAAGKEKRTASKPAGPALVQPRQADGDGSVSISGDLKTWHKVTLTLNGPYGHEKDNEPNVFTDHDFSVTFTHSSGSPSYTVPGYFAADGDAANSSAESGTIWKAHLSPDEPGDWSYKVHFKRGKGAALGEEGEALASIDGKTGTFSISASNKQRPDLRARGRLQYAGKHHLQFAGDKSWFIKAGADAPETLLGYKEFDGTRAHKPGKVPLKSYTRHIGDWTDGDPVWKGGKGKGLIGAISYLSSKGMNAFSFLPYNAGGDGDNVWPFIEREFTLNYDCSKLDQWGVVFDHATNKGMFLHFKLQETENDDLKGPGGAQSLDGGDCGPERKLYLRELCARFGHNLALNWNLGEENTQTLVQRKAMAEWIRKMDAYGHPIVVHTYPQQQDKVYGPHLGKDSLLDGLSLQNNSVKNCHNQVVNWTRKSAEAGKPWVVSFDEPGDAGYGMPADDDYANMAEIRRKEKKKPIPTVDDVRKYTLWGTILAGGGGVEYYFGYKLPENDLLCEDWRSRDQSWDYARYALEFFRDQKIPFQDMVSRNELVGNSKNENSRYCYAKEGEIYLVYLPEGGSTDLELPVGRSFTLAWFNPRTGEMGDAKPLNGKTVTAPGKEDWLAVVR